MSKRVYKFKINIKQLIKLHKMIVYFVFRQIQTIFTDMNAFIF